MTGLVLVGRADGVTWLTLNRPAEGNALSMALAEELREAVAAAEGDTGCRVLVLRGCGRFFSAGGDVKGMAEAPDAAAFVWQLAAVMHEVVLALRRSRLIVIAAVDGTAAGAGIGLALAADLLIASDRAKFVGAYAAAGLTPDCGVSFFLPRVIGAQRAAFVLQGGRSLDAATAAEWGLVGELVATDEFDARVHSLAASVAGGAAQSLEPTKRLLTSDLLDAYEAHLVLEQRSISAMAAVPDTLARIHAFAAR